MKKKVFSKPLIFFSDKEDVTVDIHIGYVGRSNNIKAVVTTCIRQRLTEDRINSRPQMLSS